MPPPQKKRGRGSQQIGPALLWHEALARARAGSLQATVRRVTRPFVRCLSTRGLGSLPRTHAPSGPSETPCAATNFRVSRLSRGVVGQAIPPASANAGGVPPAQRTRRTRSPTGAEAVGQVTPQNGQVAGRTCPRQTFETALQSRKRTGWTGSSGYGLLCANGTRTTSPHGSKLSNLSKRPNSKLLSPLNLSANLSKWPPTCPRPR